MSTATPPSFTQFSLHLLIQTRDWQQAAWKLAENTDRARERVDGSLPIHLACQGTSVPLYLIRQLLQAFPESIYSTTSGSNLTPIELAMRFYKGETHHDSSALICFLANEQRADQQDKKKRDHRSQHHETSSSRSSVVRLEEQTFSLNSIMFLPRLSVGSKKVGRV
jgi:hypothetical protein